MTQHGSPRPISLNVGVTGHRAGVLTAPLVRRLRPVIYTIFRQLRDAKLRLQQGHSSFSAAPAAELRLHTPLATGADQLAATCARSSGYVVRALLPFEPTEYLKDFAPGDELASFEQALAAADEVVALAGSRSDVQAAYVLVARSLVETADVMVAIWDGERGRGPGGTAHVVELALGSSVPLIHVDIDEGSDRVSLRALIDGEVAAVMQAPDLSGEIYDRLLRSALRPAPAPGGAGRMGSS